MASFAIGSMGAADEGYVRDALVCERGGAMRPSISEMDGRGADRQVEEEGLRAIDTHQRSFWKHWAPVVAGLGRNDDRSWGTRDIPLDG